MLPKVVRKVNLPPNLLPESKVNLSLARARVGASDSGIGPDFVSEFESSWELHLKHARSEPKDMVFQMLLSMQHFDVEKFRARHAPYCEAWKRQGWQYCPLTFLGWIQAGMPDPPPPPETAKDRQRRELMERYEDTE